MTAESVAAGFSKGNDYWFSEKGMDSFDSRSVLFWNLRLSPWETPWTKKVQNRLYYLQPSQAPHWSTFQCPSLETPCLPVLCHLRATPIIFALSWLIARASDIRALNSSSALNIFITCLISANFLGPQFRGSPYTSIKYLIEIKRKQCMEIKLNSNWTQNHLFKCVILYSNIFNHIYLYD